MNESDLRDLLPDERALPTDRRRDMEERLMEQIEAEGRTSRRHFRLLVGAAAAIVGAVVGVVVAGDDGDRSSPLGGSDECAGETCPPDTGERDGEASTAGAVELVTALRDLVMAVQDERNMATVELIGQADIVELPHADAAEARHRTDAAVAELRALVDADPAGSPYQPVLDDLAGLAALRGDVDADAGPRDMTNVDTANEVFGRYGQVVTGLLDAQAAFVATIDDPELRDGAEVYQLVLRQQELTAALGRAAVLTTLEPGEPAVTELSRLYELVQQGNDALVGEAAGTRYEEVVAAAVGELDASGFLPAVGAMLEGSPENIPAMLDAMESVQLQWGVAVDDIEDGLTAAG